MGQHIQPRRMEFPFDPASIPVHWHRGNTVASHAVNGMNLVFPDGERFFIRAVRHWLPQVQDRALRERARGFFQQEAHHGHAHEQAFRMLEAQGFELESWLAWYRRVAYDGIERRSPALLRLSVTAALEHLTASLGHWTLSTEPDPFADAHPVMRDLMRWHSAEEIEHKSVAFDVYQAVGGGYTVRVLGMALGLGLFLLFWTSATRHIAAQDPVLAEDPGRWRRDRRALHGDLGDARMRLFRYAADYLRPGFHPDDRDDYTLAEAALRELGAGVPAAS